MVNKCCGIVETRCLFHHFVEELKKFNIWKKFLYVGMTISILLAHIDQKNSMHWVDVIALRTVLWKNVHANDTLNTTTLQYSAILRNFTLIFAKTVEMLQLSDLSLKSCILIILTGMIFHVCDTCNVSSQEWSNRKITAVIAMQSENCNAKTSRCHDSTNNTNRETVSKSGNDSVIEQL